MSLHSIRKFQTSICRSLICSSPKQQRLFCVEVFNKQHKRLQKQRAQLAPDAHEYNYLRDEVAARLVDRLDDILTHKFELALDLGCNTGELGRKLEVSNNSGIKVLYEMKSYHIGKSTAGITLPIPAIATDSNAPLPRTIKRIDIIGDEEFIPFADKSLDLVISNLNLHWVNDLPSTFSQIKNCLKDDGLFLATMLGDNTLKELRNSFALAEQEVEGGISPHTSPFARVADIGNLLTAAKFNLTTVDTEIITINYADPFTLMRDLKGMGENNAVLQRRPYVKRDTFMAAASIYKSMFGNPDGSVPATFQVIWIFVGIVHDRVGSSFFTTKGYLTEVKTFH